MTPHSSYRISTKRFKKTFIHIHSEREREESDRLEIDEQQFDKRELTPLSKRCSLYSICVTKLRLPQETSKATKPFFLLSFFYILTQPYILLYINKYFSNKKKTLIKGKIFIK